MARAWSIRRAHDADLPAIVELARHALGWDDDPRHERLFRWKHLENPTGTSPMWVAETNQGLVGFRAMMRWSFTTPDGATCRAVRAVDTATHESVRRQGVFAALTEHAVDSLTDEGVGLVFNTPNDQSRPGYLKLGWRTVGRLPVRLHLGGVSSVPRLVRARTAAEKWGLPCDVGESVATAIDSVRLRDAQPQGLRTAADEAFLRWRYGLDHLGYRATPHDDGWAVFRLRRRGGAVELVLATIIGTDRPIPAADVRRLVRSCGADHALTVGRTTTGLSLPVPHLGPTLVTRALAEQPPADATGWDLELGDVELF